MATCHNLVAKMPNDSVQSFHSLVTIPYWWHPSSIAGKCWEWIVNKGRKALFLPQYVGVKVINLL